jgi:uncharacterized membrane protein YfcA
MFELSLEVWELIILALSALGAGFVDSIAGGGGMITIPFLLIFRIPPILAFGTNKLQASFGSVTAGIRYFKKGLIDKTLVLEIILWTALGAALGTFTVSLVDKSILERMIPLLLLALFIFVLAKPDLGSIKKHALIKAGLFAFLGGMTLGFYDGFFGPGTGSFWTIAFVVLVGFDLKTATAHSKIGNATSNLVSLLVFFILGHVLVIPGLIMGVFQIAGAWIGSHVLVTKGIKVIRVIFLTVLATSIVYLVLRNFGIIDFTQL